ncbi:MAG: hypothetical protein AAGD33_18960, partial [Actinomycetota bacterium]
AERYAGHPRLQWFTEAADAAARLQAPKGPWAGRNDRCPTSEPARLLVSGPTTSATSERG